MTNVAERRETWLEHSKTLVEVLYRRKALCGNLCPQYDHDEDEHQDLLRDLAVLDSQVNEMCAEIAELEPGNPPIGGQALFNTADIPEPIRCALALLALARISATVDADLRDVGDVVELAAGHDVVAALEVRQAFRAGSALRRQCHAERHPNIDRFSVSLSEVALCKLLGEDPDDETSAITELACDTWSRR